MSEITARIHVIDPVPGVVYAIQRGKTDVDQAVKATAKPLAFEFTLRVGDPRPSGIPSLLGPYAQGPADGRFVYINMGTSAGQFDSCWTRRAKISLTGLTAKMISEAMRGKAIEVSYIGTGRDGGPSCATVPLLDGGWKLVPR